MIYDILCFKKTTLLLNFISGPLCTFSVCDVAVGLASGIVLDSMLSASSSFDVKETAPGRGRVNQTRSKSEL